MTLFHFVTVRVALLLLCTVYSFKHSIFPKLPVVNKWALNLYNIPAGGWSTSTFTLKDRLPEDISSATKNTDVVFWNKVKSAVDKIEGEGKQCSDVVMIQVVMQLVSSKYEGHPERLFDTGDIDYPPPGSVPVTTSEPSPLDLTALVKEAITRLAANSIQDIAKVMADIKNRVEGKDMLRASELVKNMLSDAAVSAVAGALVQVKEAFASSPGFSGGGGGGSGTTAAPAAAAGGGSSGAAPASGGSDVNAIVKEAITRLGATGLKDMAKVMTDVRGKIDPKDSGKVSEVAKTLLTEAAAAAAKAAAAAPPVPVEAPPPKPVVDLSGEDQELVALIKETIENRGAKTQGDANKVVMSVMMKNSSYKTTTISFITKALMGLS